MSKLKSLLNIIIILTAVLLLHCNSCAKGTAGNAASLETRYIVDMPTAGVLPKKTFAIRSLFFTGGGAEVYALFAPWKNFNAGLSYGMNNILGYDDIELHSLPGLQVSYRILNERVNLPAITLGFNSQGIGRYDKTLKRCETLSPGFYLATSKNFEWAAGYIALHGGVGYTFEQKEKYRSPNVWFGLEQSVGPWAAINLEYNTNLDEEENQVMKHRGMFNAALRIALTHNITIDLQVRDLLGNANVSEPYQRYFSLDYIGSF